MDTIDSALGPLKPTLQTVIRSLPGPFHTLVYSLLGEQCTGSLLYALDFSSSNEKCFKLAISKALGVAIIGASAVVKIPQLLKLVSSQSATGLSFSSYFLETLSFLVTLAYSIRSGFPFSTFGETALISVQNIVIAALILVYSGRGASAAAFVGGVGTLIYALLGPGEMVGADMLRNLQAGSGVLGLASKIPQIWTIWREGTTGQLSAFAVFNYLLGSLSRVFTTKQEIADPMILYMYMAGFALNAVLALQMLYHWNSKPSKSAGRSSKSSNKTATPLSQGARQSKGSNAATTSPKSSGAGQGGQSSDEPGLWQGTSASASGKGTSTRRRG